jgi:hypothetical protein
VVWEGEGPDTFSYPDLSPINLPSSSSIEKEEYMPKSQNPTIVVTWDLDPEKLKDFNYLNYYATVEAMPKMPIRVKGAGFDPEESVTITICQKNIGIAKVVANSCGAFVTKKANIPANLPFGVTSVKAMVKEIIRASWPLNIVEDLLIPKVPKLRKLQK